MNIEIQSAQPRHLAEIIRLMREFAEYEKLLDFFDVTKARLHQAMFGEGAFVEGLVALNNDKPIGYALFYPDFASFRGQRGLYLEDIFVSSEHRGRGIGKSMLRELARLARSRGYERIDFQVLDWNKTAIGFYEGLGAVLVDNERHFKFTDKAFNDLAS